MTTTSEIPHREIVVRFCIAAITGYAVLCAWAVIWSDDKALIGDVVGTWKSFAVAAFAFWVGSSSGGKAKDNPTGKPGDPVNVKDVEA